MAGLPTFVVPTMTAISSTPTKTSSTVRLRRFSVAKRKGPQTESQKQKASRQPLNTISNKARKLAKHVRRNPNDQQAVLAGPNEGTIKLQSMRSQQRVQSATGFSHAPYQETVPNQARPQRFKQTNEDHLGLVRISAATLLKLHQYKNILLGTSQSLSEANSEFSTDPLK